MIRRFTCFILLSLILFDLGFSFLQHLGQPLDGDMARVIVPSNDIKQILESPLGTAVVFNAQSYPNPNRFFSHWSMKEYFQTVPLFLQKVFHPIDSVYLSSAISKILLQILLIVLIVTAITGINNWFKLDFVIAAALITPLFQTYGFRSSMGIIAPNITYTFFYTLPCALLLLYLLPFMLQIYHKEKPPAQLLIKILWIPFAFVICLSGPLNPGIVLILSALVLLNRIENNYVQIQNTGILNRVLLSIKNVPGVYWFYLLPVCILSIYSFYIGMYNSENTDVALSELFSKIPGGIYNLFTQNLGFPILFLLLTLNVIIIKRNYNNAEGKKILNLFKWIVIFALIYILSLPFGGYRVYRPDIVRYDTIMPITISLIFMFGSTTLFIVKHITSAQKMLYIPVIILMLFVYTIVDRANFDYNTCQRAALKEISESKDSIVQLYYDCNVLSWKRIRKPEDSELNAQLLQLWAVTKEKKLYYNK